jgi:hypothetical protein
MVRLTTQLNDIWESVVDNPFAQAVMSQIDVSNILPRQAVSSLCQDCQNLDFSSSSLYTKDSLSGLKEKSKSCDLCTMFFRCSRQRERSVGIDVNNIQFNRIGSAFQINHNGPPVLSIYGSTGMPNIICVATCRLFTESYVGCRPEC